MSGAARRATRTRNRQRCVLGIDVGGTSIRAGLFVPRSGSIRHVRAIRTDAVARRAAGAGARGGRRARSRGSRQQGRIVGATRWASACPSWSVRTARSRAAQSCRGDRLECRKAFAAYGDVTIASDVRAAALAEARLGAARGSPTFLYVGVGTGISSTLFIDGRPYLGAHGHAIAFASGATCAAEARDGGTVFAPLESRASGPALVAARKRWAITPRMRRKFAARRARGRASRAAWSTPRRPSSPPTSRSWSMHWTRRWSCWAAAWAPLPAVTGTAFARRCRDSHGADTRGACACGVRASEHEAD